VAHLTINSTKSHQRTIH